MVKKSKPYKTYPKEFKLEALRLVEEPDRPASEIARELGIRRNLLYKWKEQMAESGDIGTRKRGRPKKDEQSENAKLKQELKRLKEENEILKKAAVGSIRECNTPLHHLFRSLKFQHFSWSFV